MKMKRCTIDKDEIQIVANMYGVLWYLQSGVELDERVKEITKLMK
jgi:hypothetical protein